jgi:hypothetical protein
MLAFAVLSGPTSVAGQERTLTSSDIDEAIRWGEDGNPSPYLLHHAQTEGTTNDGVVGVVYTPFMRVALLAKAVHDHGGQLTPEDIPPSVWSRWSTSPFAGIAATVITGTGGTTIRWSRSTITSGFPVTHPASAAW